MIRVYVDQGQSLKDRITDLEKQAFQVTVKETSVEAAAKDVVWHTEPYYSNGADDGYYSFSLYFTLDGIPYYRTCTMIPIISAQAVEIPKNKLPETIQEEDLQAAGENPYGFSIHNASFAGTGWSHVGDRITLSIPETQNVKAVVPDLSACIRSVMIQYELYEVLVRDLVWHEESFFEDVEDEGDYTCKIYFYMNGAYYYQSLSIVQEPPTEKVSGTIRNRGELIEKELISGVSFYEQSESHPNQSYYTGVYDGKVLTGAVAAGTYSVSVQFVGGCSVSAGNVTITKGVENEISLDLNVTFVSGKITENGGKCEYTAVFFRGINDHQWCSSSINEDGSFRAVLPEDDYNVIIGMYECGKIQVSGSQSEMTWDYDLKRLDLASDQQLDCTLSADGATVMFEFTPDETAVYNLKGMSKGSVSELHVTVSSEGHSTSTNRTLSEEKDTWTNFLSEVMVAGSKYQIYIRGVDLTEDVDTAILLTKSDLPQTIEVNQVKTWEQSRGGTNSYYYQFTAPEDGSYQLTGSAVQEEALEDWNFVRYTLYGNDIYHSKEYEFASNSSKGTIEDKVTLKKGDVIVAEVYVNAYTMSGDFQISKAD